MEHAGLQSSRRPISKTIIYKRQSWAKKIINKKKIKQGRGKPRKQYLIRWEPFWVNDNRFTAPELLQNWKKKKALKNKR